MERTAYHRHYNKETMANKPSTMIKEANTKMAYLLNGGKRDNDDIVATLKLEKIYQYVYYII